MTEQCHVKFQIGSYQDDIICDIIEMVACHVLLSRPWKFDREEMHEGKRNFYSFEMNGKKHSIHPLKGKQEDANDQLLIMTDKKIVNDWKAEENDNEVELTNMVCSGWLKGKTDQKEMSNASMALMEQARYEVVKNNGKCMVTEITKDGDVRITRKREEGQRIQV